MPETWTPSPGASSDTWKEYFNQMPERKRPHNIAFTPSLWAAIEAEAARQNRSVTNWLATVATKALEESK